MLSWLNKGNEERVGLIFEDSSAMELKNISPDPTKFFTADPAEMMKYGDSAVATWHTHPTSTADLSTDDYIGFLMWPKCLHIIIGTDRTRGYFVKNGAVLKDESESHPAWCVVRNMAARLRV